MAKLSMKDYEDFLKEEARQDRLQEELESLGSEEDWWDYQRKQKEDEYQEMMLEDDYLDYGGWDEDNDWDEDDDWDEDNDCSDENDLLDVDVPCESDDSLTAEDLYDMYAYSYEEYDFYEYIDPLEEELISEVQEVEEDTVEEKRILKNATARNQQEDRICKKAVARNRHHSFQRSKERNNMVSEIIKEQHHISNRKNRKKRKRLKKLLKKAS